MANIKFTNFARSKLTVGISAGATTITITGASGALFPALTAGQYFYATLESAALAREIVKVTARAGDTLTITRAQDNTTALAWNAGDVFALRFNAAAITDFLDNARGATGGGTDEIFYENSQTVTTSYTITTNRNAMTAGPITINSGVTITVPTGSTWSIV